MLVALLLLLAPPGVTSALAQGQPDVPPEAASGRAAKALTIAHRHMVVAAHPLAAEAGRAILNAGGNALDAAIATQLVLGVVEPQSSGLGGGGFLLHYDAKSRAVTAWDGRETAPAAARPERFLTAEGRPMRFGDAVASGLSVGTPGLLAMLEAAHREGGRMGWQALFAPALRIADDGFAITPRLASLIAADRWLKQSPAASAVFHREDGSPKQAGDRLYNRDLGRTLRRISRDGSRAFYEGDIAADIVAAVRGAARPGDLSEADLAAYQPKKREVLCTPYRQQRICGMPPPSSGAATIGMMLGVLERFPLARMKPDSADAAHLFAEAGRLAYADRDRYLADPDFVSLPLRELLDPAYLARRSALIQTGRSMGRASPGLPATTASFGEDHTEPLPATSHVSVVDRDGNAVALTTSIESAFGSRIMVHGMLLNNQLTDFSLLPTQDGQPAANRVEPGKRPRSSMSPTLVFDASGQLRHVLGSPGGSMIINYVARTLLHLVDWKQDPQAAVNAPNLGSRNRNTELEAGPQAAPLAEALRQRGHEVSIGEETSGLHVISVLQRGGRRVLQGGADPRRDGVAAGD
jgi:gamma-glutamyltranspeptidase/glutathione hydrolase